jgi:hypothetical protein
MLVKLPSLACCVLWLCCMVVLQQQHLNLLQGMQGHSSTTSTTAAEACMAKRRATWASDLLGFMHVHL